MPATEATPHASAASASASTPPAQSPAGVAGSSEPITPPAADAAPSEFMRELVAAMRGVADHQRESGLSNLKARADEQVTRLRTASEERAADMQKRAEVDIAGIGDWAKSEAERIRGEAESRVAARRSQLDEQLAAETRRAELESEAVRTRVAEYERELEAYYAQLTEFSDPAAFAAAAKRIPSPPELGQGGGSPSTTPPTEAVTGPMRAAEPTPAAEPPTVQPPTVEPPTAAESPVEGASGATVESAETPETAAETAATEEPSEASVEPEAPADGGEAAPAPAPDAPETVASSAEPASASAAEAQPGESRTTSIIVKGLASFGAITGFRQSLAALEGIEGVQLSLGPTGEFVYRATHLEGFDIESAIGTLEGGSAEVNREEDGTIRVTVSRGR